MSHACHPFWKCYKTLTFWSLLTKSASLALPRETTSQRPKVARTYGLFNILPSKCASRHNGVHFFDSATSKSAPKLRCFAHFDFEMCFAPRWRALFRHRNFQKWSEHGVCLHILTSKCASRHNGVHFFDISTSKNGPSMVCVLYILTSKCASRHNGVHFFDISTSKSVFCTFWLGNVLRATTACNFSSLIWPAGSAPALASLLFDPPELQIIGKTQCFATFLPFRAPAASFFWLFLFSDLLSAALLFSSLILTTSAFHLSILSEVWLLNFLRSYRRIILCIFISIAIYLYIFISFYLYMYIFTHAYIHVHLPIPIISIPIPIPIPISICLSIHPSIHPSINLSIHPYIHPCIHLKSIYNPSTLPSSPAPHLPIYYVPMYLFTHLPSNLAT